MSTRQQRQASDGVLSVNHDGMFVVNAVVRDDEPKYVTFSRAFVLVINILSFLGGLALLGVGVYVFIEFETKFSGLLSQNAAIGGIVAGVILSLISCFGIYGLVQNRIPFLIVYVVVLVAILITILSVLGLFVEYINTVSQVSSGSLTVFTARQVEVNDFFASAYTKCCVQNALFCNSSIPSTEGYCPPVPFCANRTGNEICYAGDYGATPNNPPKLVFQEFCGTLVAFGMAGPATTDSGLCGFPSGAAGFMQKVFTWVASNVTYPYICIGLLSAIIFLEVIFTLLIARYVHLVNTGDDDLLSFSSRKKKIESSKPDTKSAMISIADQYRLNEDEFDASLRQGISGNTDENKSHKSGKWTAANPVFRSLIPKSTSLKVENESDSPIV